MRRIVSLTLYKLCWQNVFIVSKSCYIIIFEAITFTTFKKNDVCFEYMYMLSNTEHYLILNIFCMKILPGKAEASSNYATTSGTFSFLGQLMIWFCWFKTNSWSTTRKTHSRAVDIHKPKRSPIDLQQKNYIKLVINFLKGQ